MILTELKALANEKRLKIICVLAKHNFCQFHIIELTKLSQVDTSRSLKALVDCGLVESHKIGNRVIFSLSNKMQVKYALQLVDIEQEYSYLLDNVDITAYAKECENLTV